MLIRTFRYGAKEGGEYMVLELQIKILRKVYIIFCEFMPAALFYGKEFFGWVEPLLAES